LALDDGRPVVLTGTLGDLVLFLARPRMLPLVLLVPDLKDLDLLFPFVLFLASPSGLVKKGCHGVVLLESSAVQG
jgi:hypothetical protein